MSWEKEEERRGGMNRREWVRLGMAGATLGTLGALGGLSMGQILPPPVKFSGEIRETINYTKFPTPQWWNGKAGNPVRAADFNQDWLGATGVWRGLFSNGQYVPGTGFPVLVIRVKRDDSVFQVPPKSAWPAQPPEGFDLYYDDPATEARILVFFDRCVHLCCYPGWHVVHDPPPDRTYLGPTPTYETFDQDPIYCVCHGSQYEPLRLVVNTNDKNGVPYLGADHVHGPANRALPVIPVKSDGGTLVGGMADARWYVYC